MIWVCILILVNSLLCFYLGSYVTSKAYKHEPIGEIKRRGKVIRLSTKKKNQIEADKEKVKTRGTVSMEEWNG